MRGLIGELFKLLAEDSAVKKRNMDKISAIMINGRFDRQKFICSYPFLVFSRFEDSIRQILKRSISAVFCPIILVDNKTLSRVFNFGIL